MEVSRPILGGWDGIQCFYIIKINAGGPQTLGAKRFPRPPEPALRGLFCAHNRPPAHHCCVVVQRAINVGRAVSVHAITPPLSRFGELARCTIFGQSNDCRLLRVGCALPPRGGWCPGGTIHPGGPAPPRPPTDRAGRQRQGGPAGGQCRYKVACHLPTAGPPLAGAPPARRAGGSRADRSADARSGRRGGRPPREAARPARPGERPPSWRVFFGRRRSG